MFNTNGLSLSDIAAVTDRNGDGIGGNNGWWILIVLLALFGGWGNRGGAFGYDGSGASSGYVLASDFSNIERKIDGVNNGLCDGFYAMNTGMLNGFAGVNAAISSGFAGVNNAVCTLGYQDSQNANGINTNLMQSTNALQAQLNQCCCENREAIAQVRYDMATNQATTNQLISQTAQNIMQNCNANYRSLHDEMVQSQLAAKDAEIARLNSLVERQNLRASQLDQTADIVNQVWARMNANKCCGNTCGC